MCFRISSPFHIHENFEGGLVVILKKIKFPDFSSTGLNMSNLLTFTKEQVADKLMISVCSSLRNKAVTWTLLIQ